MKTPKSRASNLLLVLLWLIPIVLPAATISLAQDNTGYYWYTRDTWTGGSDTQTGFSFGDDVTGLIHARNNYQYYGGASRHWDRCDAYLQCSLEDLEASQIESAYLWLHVETNSSSAATMLRHLGTQSTAATGNASQQLVGTVDVLSSSALVLGWNKIDVTAFIVSDLGKSYAFSAFSIPQFGQNQDEDRILSFHGASASAEWRPYLEVTAIPEATATAFCALGLCALIFRRRIFI